MWRPLLLIAWVAVAQPSSEYFQIRIVDQQTGRGVPLVELRTTNQISSWTDSNGIVAWNELGLMDRPVYFSVGSPGYAFVGGGRTLNVVRGSRVELRIRRVNIAERLYRVTGQGIYRDSLLTGFPVPVREPLLNGMVMGQDTVRAALYRGKLFWLWGDTDRPNGPLGNFNTTAATSDPAADPATRLDLTYFTGPDGFVKQMIPWTGRMTWMHALMNLRDDKGAERLVSYYEVIRSLGNPERAGLAVFNDVKQQFDPLVEFPDVPAPGLEGNVFPVRAAGREYYYITGLRTGGSVRVPADWKAVQDLKSYESFEAAVWTRGLPRDKRPPNMPYIDIQTGENVSVQCDGIAWNSYRKRWIAVAQRGGEVWFAEADSPTGPWVYAARVADHGRYTFYWPVLHSFFDQDGGRLVYFQGTYTDTFSGNPVITPRYNYNQIMYRLALDDPRLFLPAPVYRLRDGRYLMREGVTAAGAWDQVQEVPFFALPLDRRRSGTVPVAGLFHAVALDGRSPDSAAGDWSCTTDDKTNFALQIGDQGSVQLDLLGEQFTNGTFREEGLRVNVTIDGTTYHLHGRYREGSLSGEWAEDGGGTFTCTRTDTESWRNSRALVPLYNYDGTYTVEPRPGSKPIAKVWRNPLSVLPLDREAAASVQ
jgi:hypothetical protein